MKGLKLRARATGELSNAQINLEGQMKEAAFYNPDGGTTEGGGGNPGGGESGGGSDGDQGENPLG